MEETIKNVPPKSAYEIKSEKAFFSYPENQEHFQIGYYGVTPNASVAGKLHLRFPPSSLLASKIELTFKAYEKVHWTKQSYEIKPELNLETKELEISAGGKYKTYKAKEIIANKTIQLWKTSKPDGNYEEVQNMDIPFEIELPEDLFPSIKIDKGDIKCKLIANIERESNLWKLQGSNKHIKLPIDLVTFIHLQMIYYHLTGIN
jgi:hypothetical protein